MYTQSSKRKAQDEINTSIENEKKTKDEKNPMDGLMHIKNKKRRKGQTNSTLFRQLPDEMALNILSFCSTEDSKNTRVWQTEIVQRCTTTTCKLEAAKTNNFDAMKWIYNYIGDTKFNMENEKQCYGINTWTGR